MLKLLLTINSSVINNKQMRRKGIARIKKTMHVLPTTAEFIESVASSRGIYEASVIDEAIAHLMRKKEYADFKNIA